MQKASEIVVPTGKQVRAARAVLGLTQHQLAEKVGIGINTLLAFEKGKRPPYDSTVEKIRSTLEGLGIRFLATGGVTIESHGQ